MTEPEVKVQIRLHTSIWIICLNYFNIISVTKSSKITTVTGVFFYFTPGCDLLGHPRCFHHYHSVHALKSLQLCQHIQDKCKNPSDNTVAAFNTKNCSYSQMLFVIISKASSAIITPSIATQSPPPAHPPVHILSTNMASSQLEETSIDVRRQALTVI